MNLLREYELSIGRCRWNQFSLNVVKKLWIMVTNAGQFTFNIN